MPLGKLLPHCGLLLDLLPIRGWKRPYSTQKWSSKGHWARHQQRWIHMIWKQGWPQTGEEHQGEDWGSSYVNKVTGNSLYPWTHTILLPSRIHVSFCVSTVLWIALSRRTWKGETVPLWGLESWRPESSHLSPLGAPSHFLRSREQTGRQRSLWAPGCPSRFSRGNTHVKEALLFPGPKELTNDCSHMSRNDEQKSSWVPPGIAIHE